MHTRSQAVPSGFFSGRDKAGRRDAALSGYHMELVVGCCCLMKSGLQLGGGGAVPVGNLAEPMSCLVLKS